MAKPKSKKVVKPKSKKVVKPIKLARNAPRRKEAPSTPYSPPTEGLGDEADAEFPTDGALRQIATLAETQIKLEAKVAEAERHLSECAQELKVVAEDLLPTAMQEARLSMFELTDGRKITVRPDISCSLPKVGDPLRDAALDWLERNNLGGIIKRVISVSFAREEEKEAEALLKAIYRLKLVPELDEAIHSSTLKATLKEVIAKGIIGKSGRAKRVNVPLPLFNAHPYSKAVIK
jgi:hypothetical protein